MKPWSERPQELAALLNPAFCGLVLRQVAKGYSEVVPTGLPYALAFLPFPLLLASNVRRELPGSTATTLPIWLQRRPEFLIDFAEHARALVPFVREALLFALHGGLLKLEGSGQIVTTQKRIRGLADILRGSDEVEAIYAAAPMVGRWMAKAGPAHAVFSTLGVRP